MQIRIVHLYSRSIVDHLQTHAYGPEDSLQPILHSCYMRKTPPVQVPGQIPLLQAVSLRN